MSRVGVGESWSVCGPGPKRPHLFPTSARSPLPWPTPGLVTPKLPSTPHQAPFIWAFPPPSAVTQNSLQEAPQKLPKSFDSAGTLPFASTNSAAPSSGECLLP